MERFSFIFLVAGIGFFVLAFVASAWLPMLPVRGLEVRSVEVAPTGADTWRVRMIVQNTGWLPSYVSKMAIKRNLLRGVLAEIELPDGAGLLSGKAREELGELEGWAYLHTGISFWPTKNVTADRVHVDWVVQGKAGSTVRLKAWHERAGLVETTARLV